jgi:hypothetical protein
MHNTTSPSSTAKSPSPCAATPRHFVRGQLRREVRGLPQLNAVRAQLGNLAPARTKNNRSNYRKNNNLHPYTYPLRSQKVGATSLYRELCQRIKPCPTFPKHPSCHLATSCFADRIFDFAMPGHSNHPSCMSCLSWPFIRHVPAPPRQVHAYPSVAPATAQHVGTLRIRWPPSAKIKEYAGFSPTPLASFVAPFANHPKSSTHSRTHLF